MSLYVQVPIQQIADGLTAIGWSSGGGGGDASLTYSAIEPSSPTNGVLWYDTSSETLKMYNGGTWSTVSVSQAVISQIQGYAASSSLASSSAEDAANAAISAKDAIVNMQVATGAAGSSVTWNGTTLTVPQGLQGIKGDTGEVTLAQLNAALANVESALITKPTITSPASGAIDYAGAITATYTTASTYVGVQDYVKWEAGNVNFSTIHDSYEGSSNLTSWSPSVGLALTTVYVRVKQGSDGHLSTWSDTLSFTTPNIYIQNPTLTVTGTPSGRADHCNQHGRSWYRHPAGRQLGS